MTVLALVLRSGGDFDPEYVDRILQSAPVLDAMMRGRLRPVVLTDLEGVDSTREGDVLPLERADLRGWWSKVEIFRLAEIYGEPVLYMDLDTIVVGSLDPLLDVVETTDRPVMLRDFFVDDLASGIVALPAEPSLRFVMDDCTVATTKAYTRRPLWGDGAWMRDSLQEHGVPIARWQDYDPDWIQSMKQIRREGCRVLCYHGQPRPRDTGWAQE